MPLIEGNLPDAWKDLECQAARILAECGFDVAVQKNVRLARGDVKVDVYAVDDGTPPTVILAECKHWATPVSKAVVHAFRSVVSDSGANTGLLVSSGGFQGGARDAACHTNIHLVNWAEFQEMFRDRWYRDFMVPHLREVGSPLHEYTEPINSRIARKEGALDRRRRDQVRAAREKYMPLAAAVLFLAHGFFDISDEIGMPQLPLRSSVRSDLTERLPDDVLDARALRPLLWALEVQCREAVAAFDGAFGERA
jgi:restriction system protein